MMKSDTIGALATALAKAQGEFGPVAFNTTNKFLNNRYADLGAVIEAAKPIIASHGLSVAQLTEDGGENAIGVTTILMHSSGEWLSAHVSLPLGEEKGKSRAQVAGSIVSYLRRYAYTSILGLYAEEETDSSTDPNQTKGNVREHGTHTVAQTAEGRFDPRTQETAVNGGARQPAAEQSKAQQPRTQALSDEMPTKATASVIQDWFQRRLKTVQKLGWKPEKLLDNAQKLAIELDKAGMKDAERQDAYEYLAGVRSGKDMSAEQLYLLKVNSHRIPELRSCAIAQGVHRAEISADAKQAALPTEDQIPF